MTQATSNKQEIGQIIQKFFEMGYTEFNVIKQDELYLIIAH